MLSGCAFKWNRSELQIFCPVSHSWMIISFSPIQANTQKSPGSISLMLIFTKFEINAYCATITKKKRKIREKLGNWCADYESWAERVLQEAKSGYKKKASVVSARQRLHRRPMTSSFFQQRRAEDGYLVFRPSLKLRNRTRLRLFSSSFLAWNSPWILKPRCTTKAVLSTENLYPATWSSQAWREINSMRRQTWRWEVMRANGGRWEKETVLVSRAEGVRTKVSERTWGRRDEMSSSGTRCQGEAAWSDETDKGVETFPQGKGEA